jgi:hypothetical protein
VRLSVVDRLGAVAVRVEQERAVVVGRVLRALARRAVVAVAGGRADPPELVDELARRRQPGDVQAPRDRVVRVRGGEREVVPLGEVVARVRLLAPERAQQGRVEPL